MKLSNYLLYPTFISALVMAGCGVEEDETSSSKIVNGSRVSANAYTPERMGTVSLGDLVLTAAHCVGGRVNVNFIVPGQRGQSRAVERVVTHPGYRSSPRPEVDIALIKLRSEMPSTHRVMPLLFDQNQAGRSKQAVQAGYGSTKNGRGQLTDSGRALRRTDTRITGHRLTRRGGTISVYDGETVQGGSAACSGDSGGPLYVQSNGIWYTAGVTSTANAGAGSRPGDLNCSGGNQYASIAGNRDWLIETAVALTGRRSNTFDAGTLAFNGSNTPDEPDTPDTPDEPDTPDTPDTPDSPDVFPEGRFEFNLVRNGATISYEMKNVTGASISGCTFYVDIERTRSRPYRLAVQANTTFRNGEEFILNFNDQREFFSFIYGRKIGEPKLSKTCR